MVRYLFYTIGDLTYQSPLVQELEINCVDLANVDPCGCAVASLPGSLV